MSAYLTIKSILVALMLLGSFGFFFIRSQRLMHLMITAAGPINIPLDRLTKRLKILFKEVLLQSKVRENRFPGLAHTLIFFGFIAVLPHTIELMIAGIFPGFSFFILVPGIYVLYAFFADILAVLTLVGLAYCLYRRVFLKPKYLTNGLDSRLILLFTTIIILSFFSINAFRIVLYPETPRDLIRYTIVSSNITQFFDLGNLTRQQLIIGMEASYWIHLSVILYFLVYIPGSKHLHILAAIPNVVLAPLDIQKAMVKTDLEDEDVESFGLGKINELNWQNVLNLYSCTECGRCEEQCPADMTGKPLSPKAVVVDMKDDLIQQCSGNKDTIKPIIRNGSPITEDVIWSCTTCRACESICPLHIQHLDFILEIRKNLVMMESRFPDELQETFTNLEHQFNPWGFAPETRAEWCRGLDVPLMSDHPEAQILYFVGCAGSYDERGKAAARAIINLLKKADLAFAILGPEESCTGDAARRAGNEYIAQLLIQANLETLNKYKPVKILTGCPHCYNTLKNEYPQFGAMAEVVHHTEFFADLIENGRLKPNHNLEETVTLHDSCYLSRWNGIINAPRTILGAIAGLQIKEMGRSGRKGLCCGAGGSRMFIEEKIGKRINSERVEEMVATDAETVVAACPFCNTMLNDGVKETTSAIAVKDIAEILDLATDSS
ncbi:MAG: (Fe-S)-binding protein [Desulfobacterales bacterium]|jgi:Fe-S oxidoreductase